MAFGIYFDVQGMTAEKFHRVHEQLAEAGQAEPAGRSSHTGFAVGDEIKVFDVWESMEQFEAFGATLMPILAENGIDPGQPVIGEIEMLVAPAGA
jgi:hypothetical protein